MSIEDKIADLLKESEALHLAEASCGGNMKPKMKKESEMEDEASAEDDMEDKKESKMKKEDLDEAEENPTGIKIYHKDKTGKASHTIAFTHQDAARVHKEVAKEGGKVTHHALMFGTKEGPKQALSEDIDQLDEEQLVELSKKTLGSYAKKASGSLAQNGRALGKKETEQSHLDKMSSSSDAPHELKQQFYKSMGVSHGDIGKQMQKIHKRQTGINRAVDKLTKEDIDADVDALMNGENLTEEFREKATAIFEAAVMSRVTQEVESLEEEFQDRLVEYYEGAKEEIVEKVDGYLNYVVEQWMNDNELAVTTGIKNDILEGFVSGMKNLFQEHYIEVPDEKLDLVAELQESVVILESKLDESLESNVTMSKYINYVERNTITEEFCKSMTDTEVEKFKSLAEELSFEDSDTYSSKLQIIKENYFGKKPTAGTVQSIVTDSPVQLTESVQNIDPNVAQYLETFNRIKL